MIPIKYVLLEGPDAAGKTSLYRNVHKATDFRHNIHDRSFLSMLCYARLYGRDEGHHRESMIEEVCDANNFVVIVLPPVDVVVERLCHRGDEFQDEASLRRLYDIFEEETSLLQDLPNVVVVRSTASSEVNSATVAEAIEIYSRQTPKEFGSSIKRWVSLRSEAEVQFKVSFDILPQHEDPAVLNDPREGEYYLSILRDCEEVIHREISGINPYGMPQGMDSRRFYHSSDTCISSIHFLPRRGDVSVRCLLRSTDAERNGSLDLRFLEHLAASVPTTFAWNPSRIRLDVSFNSLHLRRDAV